jgi:ribosome-associated protein
MSRKKAVETDWSYAQEAAEFAQGRKPAQTDSPANARRRNSTGAATVASETPDSAASQRFKVRFGHDFTDPLQSDAQREVISKSEAKRRMEALQNIGDMLIALRPDQVKRLNLPEDLAIAVRDAQSCTEKTAKKRAAHYVGKVMRGVDADPIIKGLEKLTKVGSSNAAVERGATLWRDKLIEGKNTVLEFLALYPFADIEDINPAEFERTLEKLVSQAKREASKRVGDANEAPRYARELYRMLRDHIAAQDTKNKSAHR